MKAVSKSAEKVFRDLIELLPAGAGGESIKLDRRPGSSIMALCVERIGDIAFAASPEKRFPLYSFAHYGEQNGDLMRDPDIVLADICAGLLVPVSYRNDYLGIDREFVERDDAGRVIGHHGRAMADCAAFCSTWARNIIDQQGPDFRAAIVADVPAGV